MDATYLIITPLFAYLLRKKLTERSVAIKEGNKRNLNIYNIIISLMTIVFIALILVVKFVR